MAHSSVVHTFWSDVVPSPAEHREIRVSSECSLALSSVAFAVVLALGPQADVMSTSAL